MIASTLKRLLYGVSRKAASAGVLIRRRSLGCAIAVLSLIPPAQAMEAQKIVAVWQEYLTICSGAMQNPGQHHDDPAAQFGISNESIDDWYVSSDGQMVDFFAERHSQSIGGPLLIGLVSSRTDTMIEQSCEVALQGASGDPLAFKANLVAAFTGSPFTLHGGETLNKRGGGAAADPDLDRFMSFVTEGAFPGYNVVTTLSYLPDSFIIEHLILLAAAP